MPRKLTPFYSAVSPRYAPVMHPKTTDSYSSLHFTLDLDSYTSGVALVVASIPLLTLFSYPQLRSTSFHSSLVSKPLSFTTWPRGISENKI